MRASELEHRLGEGVRDEEPHAVSLSAQIPQQLDVHPLASDTRRPAERFVQQQDRWPSTKAPARSRRAAASRPTAAMGGGLLEALRARRARPSRWTRSARSPRGPQPSELERQRDVLRHRPPGEQHGVLEHHAVAPSRRASRAVLPFIDDVARGRLDEIADRRAAEWTCRTPRARSARRTRPGERRGRSTPGARDPAGPERLRHVTQRDDPGLARHATGSGRPVDDEGARLRATTRKKLIPSNAATRFVAMRLAGDGDAGTGSEVQHRAGRDCPGLSARQLPDDRPDNARRRGHLERREDERRGGQASAASRAPEAGPAAEERISSSARGSTPGQPAHSVERGQGRR